MPCHDLERMKKLAAGCWGGMRIIALLLRKMIDTSRASPYNRVAMRTRRGALAAAAIACTALIAAVSAVASPFPSPRDALDRIDPADRAALLADWLVYGEVSFLIILDRQADLRPAASLPGKEARGRFVFDALRAVAAQTQPDLVAALRARGAKVQPFVIVNAVGVRGSLQSLIAAAELPHAARIVADTPARVDIPSAISESPSALRDQPSVVEWGVSAINAPAVWSMGYTGTGIVVGGQDSGVRWEHTALIDQYRGWEGSSADHNFNWHDAIHSNVPGSPTPGNPCGFDAPAPCDDTGHGTHTLGTAIGDDGAGNQIGVAPGADWIACRNMDEGWGRPSTYLECFEWFLAPYPITGTIADGDPAKAPHIITNSWVCPDDEGCLTGQEIISGVLAMRAAGILTVVAAANDGPDCSTINDPPAIYAQAFSVGAYDVLGNIAGFSSRGPVTRDGSGRLKPDIAAPGVGVRSATRVSTTSYASFSGTSMATPHVAGAAALLWNAAPYLIGEADLTEWVLRLNATPALQSQNCGGDTPSSRPNNVWGWGQLDARAAVSVTFSLTPTAVLTYFVASSSTIVLDASASTDPESPPSELLFRWDFGNDGVWDTPWSLSNTIAGAPATIGAMAAVQVSDRGGRTDIAIGQVVVLPYQLLLPLVLSNGP
jgi:subtilisin family serine protease